ncbi:MAG: MltA domain-containing protein [Deltaproteobacteria bacterium]|nr:MltA domain-containing protein [Deltaproteobacteria bacterium]
MTPARTAIGTTGLLLALMFFLLAAGCSHLIRPEITKENSLERVRASKYPLFEDRHDYTDLIAGIDGSLSYLSRIPGERKFFFGKDIYTAAHLKKSLQHFRNRIDANPSGEALNRFIKDHYILYQSVGSDGKGQMLFTGYYEPTIRGSLVETPACRYPIYARPDDLTTIDLSLFGPEFKGKRIVGRYTGNAIVPYYERSEIDHTGVLDDRSEILAWVGDPIDLFFLQIQGSGKIIMESGEYLNVHYHMVNGHPYRSIGRMLIDEDKIAREEMSMQKIRSYLNAHPDEVERVLNYNPSYVFFKLEAEGPIGYIQVKLTPMRSIALDRKIFPPAALAYIETQQPELDHYNEIYQWEDLGAFVLNQDTGGAIKGPGRADLFWGNGAYAEMAAGHMQHPGKLYFLVLNPDL